MLQTEFFELTPKDLIFLITGCGLFIFGASVIESAVINNINPLVTEAVTGCLNTASLIIGIVIIIMFIKDLVRVPLSAGRDHQGVPLRPIPATAG